MRTENFSIHFYNVSVSQNKAKGFTYPHLRGTLLPSIDFQYNSKPKSPKQYEYNGIAINWLWIRVKICFPNLANFAK